MTSIVRDSLFSGKNPYANLTNPFSSDVPPPCFDHTAVTLSKPCEIKNFGELKVIDYLGRGVYGTTYLVGYQGKSYALKQLNNPGPELRNEFEVHGSLSHSHVVNVFAFINNPTPFSYMLLEYCDKGDLARNHYSLCNMTFARKVRLIQGVAKGLAYIHTANIIHRDIAARNILITKEGHPKISDFGLACLGSNVDGELTYECHKNLTAVRWTAPEATKGTFSSKSDVYAFAITCSEIFNAEVPYSAIAQDKEVIEKVMTGLRPSLPEDLKMASTVKLVEQCWDQNPAKRPSFPLIVDSLREILIELYTSHSHGAV